MIDLHSKIKNRYEYRAKNTLIAVFPDEFDNLQKSEKPDWIDYEKDTGVEIVRATDGRFLEEKKHFNSKISGVDLQKLSPKEKRSIGKYRGRIYTEKELGISETSKIAAHCYSMDEPKEILQSVVRKKIDLINSSQEVYQHLHTMFLYVLCDVGRINYADAEMLFKFMRSIQEKYKNRFATLFVDDGYSLYRYCFNDASIVYNDISKIAQEVFIRTEYEIE